MHFNTNKENKIQLKLGSVSVYLVAVDHIRSDHVVEAVDILDRVDQAVLTAAAVVDLAIGLVVLVPVDQRI